MGAEEKTNTIALPSFLLSSPSEPELQQALVPVVKELVPVRRPVWGQLCLCPLRPRRLRCTPQRLQKEGGGQTSGTPQAPSGAAKHCAASLQGYPAPPGPGATPGPAAAAGALRHAAEPVPAPRVAPPPALLPPASSSVSHAPTPAEQCLVR